jgi:Prokaryotic Cytochrome C oxidase subunit IV
MTSLIRNPLTIVWALLTTVTIASSLIALEGGASHQINTTVTTVVLLIAAFKAHMVIRHFMEVRNAPVWLKATTSGWVLGLFALLLGFYFAGL